MPKVINIDSLFHATVQLFAERGYEAMTTQEIARRADVNEATLFRRYGSKANLLKMALTHCLANSPFADLNISDNIEKDLIAIVEAYQRTFQSFGGAVMTLMIETSRHPEIQTANAALLPNIKNALEIIQTHQNNGNLSSGDPMQKLTMLLAPVMVQGIYGKSGIQMNSRNMSPKDIVHGFLEGYKVNK